MSENQSNMDYRETSRILMVFIRYVLRRFSKDRCLRLAASLSYTSLLAIVPLTAIAFSMLAAFPVFENMRGEFQSMVFANLLPQSAQAMEQYFNQFLKNTSTLSAVGIVGLALTAVLLLGTVESSMNRIFRVKTPRALAPRLLVFWAMITLGPLLLGASFSLSAYIFAATKSIGLELTGDNFGALTRFIPTFIIMVLMAAFFLVIPNRPVSRSGAVIGAIVAGLLFALLRKLFGLYVSNFPTYQTIYGAVSVVPIFLIWMYLSWAVVLVGAAITASVGEWKSSGGEPASNQLRSGPKLVVALQILNRLYLVLGKGGGVRRSALLVETGSNEELILEILEKLQLARFIDRTATDRWVLCRDLEKSTLYDLYLALGFGLRDEDIVIHGDGWKNRLRERLIDLKHSQEAATTVPIKQLLSDENDGSSHIKAV